MSMRTWSDKNGPTPVQNGVTCRKSVENQSQLVFGPKRENPAYDGVADVGPADQWGTLDWMRARIA